MPGWGKGECRGAGPENGENQGYVMRLTRIAKPGTQPFSAWRRLAVIYLPMVLMKAARSAAKRPGSSQWRAWPVPG